MILDSIIGSIKLYKYMNRDQITWESRKHTPSIRIEYNDSHYSDENNDTGFDRM